MASEKKTRVTLHILLLVAFLGGLIFVSIVYGPRLTRMLTRMEDFRAFLKGYGPLSAVVFVLVQAVQIVIAVIPGEVVQIAGGYVFGTFQGTLLSVAGTLLGTVIAFFAARWIGYSLIKIFVPPQKLARFEFLFKNPKADLAIFALFLIPGIPKDTLSYIAGLTPIRPLKFFLICMIARFPSLWGSAYIGANIQEKDYLPVYIVSGVAVALFVAGFLARDKIIAFLHRWRESRKGTAK